MEKVIVNGRSRVKEVIVKARIDREMYERLMAYCEKEEKTRTDVLREGIEMIIGKNEDCEV